ncbi:hypothetical protein KJ966_06055 [bacterium]|nr:hypothetical protein [bacterium]
MSGSLPLLKEKVSINGEVTAYLCEKGLCHLPTTDIEAFEKQLAVVYPYS